MTEGALPRAHTVIDSPVGPLTLVGVGDSLAALHLERRRYPPSPGDLGERDDTVLPEAVRQITEYFAGERTRFDLPLAWAGTPFQLEVWAALREIPFGQTMSYRELAERLGRPRGARAVGLANGRNPLSIVVPCHRLVGSNGDLTGYGGGLDRKRQLLDFERRTGARSGGLPS